MSWSVRDEPWWQCYFTRVLTVRVNRGPEINLSWLVWSMVALVVLFAAGWAH